MTGTCITSLLAQSCQCFIAKRNGLGRFLTGNLHSYFHFLSPGLDQQFTGPITAWSHDTLFYFRHLGVPGNNFCHSSDILQLSVGIMCRDNQLPELPRTRQFNAAWVYLDARWLADFYRQQFGGIHGVRRHCQPATGNRQHPGDQRSNEIFFRVHGVPQHVQANPFN